MPGSPAAPLPFGGAAFVKDQEAAAFLGLSVRSVRYLVADGRLRRVYPRPRAARVTAESLTAYREAVEAGKVPPVWSQPGNPHTAPAPQAEKKAGGLLARWGLGMGKEVS